jgi:hypothetical protein
MPDSQRFEYPGFIQTYGFVEDMPCSLRTGIALA